MIDARFLRQHLPLERHAIALGTQDRPIRGEADVEFEQRRLHDDEKRPDLAKQVEWIADTRGDGAGYDISSFNRDESPRLIEVKTTGLGKTFPFMVTANEVRASERKPQDYQLYRVFEFAKAPRLYILRGSLRENCRLEETQYRARPS